VTKDSNGVQIDVCTPRKFEQQTSHPLDSVTTIWHRVVSDSPGGVFVAKNNVVQETTILIFRDDLYI